MTADDIRQALREVTDPELGVNIVDLGLVYGIDVDDDAVCVRMTMTSPACPLRDYLHDMVESAIATRLPEAKRIAVEIVDDPPWTEDRMTDEARRQLR